MSIAIRLACLFFISALVTECYSFDSDKVNDITAGDVKENPVTGGTPFPTPTIPTTASTTKHPTTTVTTEHHTTTQHKTTHHTTEQSTKHTTEHNLTTHLPPTSHQHNITTAGHTTHAPTPSPTTAIPSHKWALNDSGVVCILFQAAITLTFEFPNKTEHREYVPIDAVPTGNCNRSLYHKDEEYITLKFLDDWEMTFIFTDKDSSYNLSQLNVSFYYSQWGYKKNESFSIFKLEHLEGNKNGQYYKCEEELTIYNSTHSNDTDEHYLIAIQLSNLQMEAFRDEKNEAFNTNGGKNCKSGKGNSNLIPIIVGSILGGLILVVLIAYLISRRRRRTGYESV